MQASLEMLLIESRWFPGTGRRNYWSLEGERCCTSGGRDWGCNRPSQGAQLCALHALHQQAEPKLVAVLLSLRRTSADFYAVLTSWPLSLQRTFLVRCLWS